MRRAAKRVLSGLTLGAVMVLLAACDEQRQMVWADFGGHPRRGVALIERNGCGSCHIIPGVDGAEGLVGPPLIKIGRRVYIAGVLRNKPDNLITWLRSPQKVVPGNAMPDMGLSEQDARDIAAYLYTLQ